MGLTLTTPPAVEPVTFAEMKSWFRLHETNLTLDDEIEALGLAAREFVEAAIGRQLISASYSATLRRFPPSGCLIAVPRPPLQSVESVSYVDTSGATITLTAGVDYRVDVTSDPGTIEAISSWPATADQPNAVEVEFTAGYGDDPSDVPEKIRTAVRILAGHWFRDREPITDGDARRVPLQVRSILGQARCWAA